MAQNVHFLPGKVPRSTGQDTSYTAMQNSDERRSSWMQWGGGEFFDGAQAKNNVFMNHNKTVHRFGTTATQNISRNVSNPINGRAERSSNRAKGRAPRGLCGTGGSGKRLCPVVYDRQYIGANHVWFLCDEDRIPVSHTDWMII